MSKKHFLDAFELFRPSARIIRDNLPAYALILVVPNILATLGGDNALGVFAFGGIVLSIAFIPALTKLYLLTAKGEETTVSKVFQNSYKYFWRLLGLSIIVGLIILAGFILLIIPGFIMMRRYVLSSFYLMDKDLGILEAMELSAKHTKPYSWKIYEVIAVAFLIALISVFGVFGLIVSTLLSLLYTVAFPIRYYEILKANDVKAGGKY